jgi:hypothetical protein
MHASQPLSVYPAASTQYAAGQAARRAKDAVRGKGEGDRGGIAREKIYREKK